MGGSLKKRFFRSGKQIKAEQQQEKQRKEIDTWYQIMRCDYDIDLLKLGLMEVSMIEYKREGITPKTSAIGLSPEDAKAKELYLRRVRKDMVRMVADHMGIEVRPREDECTECGGTYDDEGKHSCPPQPNENVEGEMKPEVEQEQVAE